MVRCRAACRTTLERGFGDIYAGRVARVLRHASAFIDIAWTRGFLHVPMCM